MTPIDTHLSSPHLAEKIEIVADVDAMSINKPRRPFVTYIAAPPLPEIELPVPGGLLSLSDSRDDEVARSVYSAENAGPESEAEKANRQRIALLIRQSVKNDLSSDEDARLAIVTAKVEALIPRVTKTDFAILDQLEAARV